MTSMKCTECQKISSILIQALVPDNNFKQTVANGGIAKTASLCGKCLAKH